MFFCLFSPMSDGNLDTEAAILHEGFLAPLCSGYRKNARKSESGFFK